MALCVCVCVGGSGGASGESSGSMCLCLCQTAWVMSIWPLTFPEFKSEPLKLKTSCQDLPFTLPDLEKHSTRVKSITLFPDDANLMLTFSRHVKCWEDRLSRQHRKHSTPLKVFKRVCKHIEKHHKEQQTQKELQAEAREAKKKARQISTACRSPPCLHA